MNEEQLGNLDELLAAGDYYLWDPQILSYVREKFAGKRVVMVDLEGTLVYPKSDATDQLRVYPEAAEMLDDLKNLGYAVVLWTAGRSSKYRQDVMKAGLLRSVDLAIFQENFSRKALISGTQEIDPEKTERFRNLYLQAIESADWINDVSKNNLREISEEFLDDLEYLSKPPHLLFRSAAVIDDLASIFTGCISGADRRHGRYWPIRVGPPGETGRRSNNFAFSRSAIIDNVVKNYPPPPNNI